MKAIALHSILLFSIHVAAAPPIAHPPTLQLTQPRPTNLTLSASNATALGQVHPLHTKTRMLYSNISPSLSPPATPFRMHIPNTALLLHVDCTYHVHDRIEHWAYEALRAAYATAHRHRRSESIADSITDTHIQWDGDSDPHGLESTDIELIPERNLTWGMFTDCLGMMHWFVANYPEWDFGFEIEMFGVAAKLGECTLVTR